MFTHVAEYIAITCNPYLTCVRIQVLYAEAVHVDLKPNVHGFLAQPYSYHMQPFCWTHGKLKTCAEHWAYHLNIL